MRRELQLVREPLSEEALRRREAGGQPTTGAIVRFLGIVRGTEAGAPILALDYEAFEPMVVHQFGKLFDEMERRWPAVEAVRLIHRLGRVEAGEASLWVEVVSPHRGEAFESCQWLIDRMKEVVPIWKKAVPADGALRGNTPS
ncbi:MAG: molybdenum cofactor biosynthesis protein MoaE [Limisphaerales bacterium]